MRRRPREKSLVKISACSGPFQLSSPGGFGALSLSTRGKMPCPHSDSPGRQPPPPPPLTESSPTSLSPRVLSCQWRWCSPPGVTGRIKLDVRLGKRSAGSGPSEHGRALENVTSLHVWAPHLPPVSPSSLSGQPEIELGTGIWPSVFRGGLWAWSLSDTGPVSGGHKVSSLF